MNINTPQTSFQKAGDVNIPQSFYDRISTGYDRLDKIFGKGLVPGSVITITGTPGVAKTTFLLTLLSLVDSPTCPTAYATGEESSEQLAYTCERLSIRNIDIGHVKTLDDVVNSMNTHKVIVIDSFQSLTPDKGMKKTAFLQYAQNTIISEAKSKGCVVFIVLHITTAGLPKGGTEIIHAVDVNIKMSVDPHTNDLRVIDTYKNRCGSTGKHYFTLTPTGFDLINIPTKTTIDIKKWIPVLGGLFCKSKNKKLKLIGDGLMMFDTVCKK